MITHCVGEGVSFIESVGINHYRLLERVLAMSTKITDVYMLLPAIPLLRIHFSVIHPHVQNAMYTGTLGAVWFVMTKKKMKSQHPLSEECLNNSWFTHKMECYAVVKNDEGILYVMIWNHSSHTRLSNTSHRMTWMMCQQVFKLLFIYAFRCTGYLWKR